MKPGNFKQAIIDELISLNRTQKKILSIWLYMFNINSMLKSYESS